MSDFKSLVSTKEYLSKDLNEEEVSCDQNV